MPRMELNGRVWIIEELVSESGARTFVRLRPAVPRPFPTKQQYREAKAAYRKRLLPAAPAAVLGTQTMDD